ncbi:cytochrome c oxidase VIII [Perkinsela sp. CCAP 1560/4]|nr:hypothetical protein XU18_5041 [Perkinsela sp. CCAP 1560/4]KNH05649.1 cytochrome c oxidase VIII [Perkinsela sp. CCAP 1560/4]|eukprot:KNH03637.1 hypothetical protein XU18_5041 [Perkinsela sp. CCAP 1560/4]
MLRTTRPAVSFSTSSVLLKQRIARPLFSVDMRSNDRLAAMWDDMPWTLAGQPRHRIFEWNNYITYELGMRRYMYGFSKLRWIMMNVGYCAFIFVLLDSGWMLTYHALTVNGVPEQHSVKYGTEFTKKWHGIDVYCADGKFIRPFFHMFPPKYTMTIEELDE